MDFNAQPGLSQPSTLEDLTFSRGLKDIEAPSAP